MHEVVHCSHHLLMLLSQCSPWWTAAPINLRLLQRLMQSEHSEFFPVHFWLFFYSRWFPSSVCPSVPCSSLPVSVKTAKNGPVKSRTAVIKQAFGIYECRGFALWMTSSQFQLPVSVVKVKQIVLRHISSLAECDWCNVFISSLDNSFN